MPLFDGSVDSWTELQLRFVGLCNFYHSIYTDPERPSDETIENDIALDRWINNKKDAERKERIKMEKLGG